MSVVDVPSGRAATRRTPLPGDPALERLSLNQKTTPSWDLPALVEGCARAGLGWVGLWREPVQEYGVERAARLVADAGLRVSTLCRGGFLTAADAEGRRTALEDNRRAIDEAAALGTPYLVMVVGGLPEGDRDLAGARERVASAIAELVDHARGSGVQLSLEPMHPIFCADRGVLSTLGQALDLAERFSPAEVGVTVDTFHVWWDPEVEAQVARAGERISSFQVCDWITPLPPDALLSRGMMGDGHIDFPHLLRAVTAAGYTGPIEVEIFNADVWAAEPAEVLATTARRYAEHVLGE